MKKKTIQKRNRFISELHSALKRVSTKILYLKRKQKHFIDYLNACGVVEILGGFKLPTYRS